MRRIDKTTVLSTVYKAWVDGLEQKNTPHPRWDSHHRFYPDVVMSLFHCQDGLCAYTEELLCEPDAYHPRKWSEGRYTINTDVPRPPFDGDAEHFDESLKTKADDEENRKDWLWENLFMVHSNVNSRSKNTAAVDSRFKPDQEGYAPENWFDYLEEHHRFIPKASLNDEDASAATAAIETLGLNRGPMKQRRQAYLNELLEKARIGPGTQVPRQFTTAYAMCIAAGE